VFLSRLFGNKIRLHNWVLKNDFILGKVLRLISNNFVDTTIPPEKAFNRFLKEVDADLRTPFFAWIHVLPPHDPYLPPEPFKRYFNPSDELRSFKSQDDIKNKSFKYLFDYLILPEEMQPDVDLMKDYYDEFIRYCDKQFEDFINKLKARNMLDNTVIILSSDHGESFEHGYFTHGGSFLYEQVTHIPLVIKEPGQNHGQVVDSLVEQIDIPATILDLVDIQVSSWMEGRSLVPLMHGKRLSQRPAFSMNFEENPSLGHQITTGSIAVWEGDYKLIHYLGREESLLFNLKQDPDELTNLFNSNPETGQRLLSLIYENLKIANEKIRNNK
jgi:arylsulfatase A-like enzyme